MDPATLRAMSQEQWQDHVKSGHYPARRDCLQCTTYGATGHQHRRVSHPSLFVLNIDIAGPFRTLGVNPHGRGRQERNRNLRYMLVAKYTLPESYITNELEETADDPEVEVPEGEADPFAEDEGGGVGLVEEEGIDWDDYEPDLLDDGPVPDPEQAEDPDKEIVVGTRPREIPEDVKAPKAANLLFAHGLADIKGSSGQCGAGNCPLPQEPEPSCSSFPLGQGSTVHQQGLGAMAAWSSDSGDYQCARNSSGKWWR